MHLDGGESWGRINMYRILPPDYHMLLVQLHSGPVEFDAMRTSDHVAKVAVPRRLAWSEVNITEHKTG